MERHVNLHVRFFPFKGLKPAFTGHIKDKQH